MRSATGPNKGAGSPIRSTGTGKSARPRLPVHKKLLPITKALAALSALASLGIMAIVLLGIWPPKQGPHMPAVREGTPVALEQAGLKIEPVGKPVRDPKDNTQVVFTVTVSNDVKMALPFEGTPTPGIPAPTAGPVIVCSANIHVIYYKNNNGVREVAGRGDGSVANLAPGQKSGPIPLYGTQIGEFDDNNWEIVADNLWGDTECKQPPTSGLVLPPTVREQPHPAPRPRTP